MRITHEEAEQYLQERFGEMMVREGTGGNCTAFINQDDTIIVTFGDDCTCNEVFDDKGWTGLIETDGEWTVGRYPTPAYEGEEPTSLLSMTWENIK